MSKFNFPDHSGPSMQELVVFYFFLYLIHIVQWISTTAKVCIIFPPSLIVLDRKIFVSSSHNIITDVIQTSCKFWVDWLRCGLVFPLVTSLSYSGRGLMFCWLVTLFLKINAVRNHILFVSPQNSQFYSWLCFTQPCGGVSTSNIHIYAKNKPSNINYLL